MKHSTTCCVSRSPQAKCQHVSANRLVAANGRNGSDPPSMHAPENHTKTSSVSVCAGILSSVSHDVGSNNVHAVGEHAEATAELKDAVIYNPDMRAASQHIYQTSNGRTKVVGTNRKSRGGVWGILGTQPMQARPISVDKGSISRTGHKSTPVLFRYEDAHYSGLQNAASTMANGCRYDPPGGSKWCRHVF